MAAQTKNPTSAVNNPSGVGRGHNGGSDRIDPTRAMAGVERWRRGVAESLGQDPGASLDRPDRRLVMLKIFGSTRRLADLCLKHPATAVEAMMEGPSNVLAEAARDLAILDKGVGGAEALHGALEPIKNRADIAIGVAELLGEWTTAQATAARTDLAERLVEAGVAWLIRGAISRGELSVSMDEGYARGVFVLAGADFAHEDLAPYGVLEMAVIYDETNFDGQAARMAERAFVRIGAELKEAFEGKPGEYPLFLMKTPFGSGVNGAGIVESLSRASAALGAEQSPLLKQWVCASRVVAGDRKRGGVCLEETEQLVWGDDALSFDDGSQQVVTIADDPRTGFREVADFLRWHIGRTRPFFRTASMREVFETAERSGILKQDVARRLVAGEEFVQIIVSRTQLMKGAGAKTSLQPDEEEALASLCGYTDYASLAAVREGVIADARSVLKKFASGPKIEFDRYRSAEKQPDDIDKLEDLGFRNGAGLANVIESWAGATRKGDAPRFSALAPGLLTAFGETQHPDEAIRLFDQVIRHSLKKDNILERLGSEAELSDSFVDAVGCFGAVVAPLAESKAGVKVLFEPRGSETPQSGDEWIARFSPLNSSASIDDVATWRRENMARIALYTAGGDMGFDAAADSLEAVQTSTLQQVFDITAKGHSEGDKLALHVFDGPGKGLPGESISLGFVADKSNSEKREGLARDYLSALGDMGTGVFALSPNVSHRPGGVAAPLTPDVAALKSYIQSEAVAHDQILLSRARVIGGDDKVQKLAATALRSAISNPRRADILFRDLDRARAQRLRRERAPSTWDLHYLEGGLFDTDLIISTLIYRHAAAQPGAQNVRPAEALDLFERSGLITAEVCETLKNAHAFWTRLATAQSLAQWSDPQREPVRRRFAQLLARAAEVEKFNQVRPIMRGYADEVSRLYSQLVLGRPSLSLVSNA